MRKSAHHEHHFKAQDVVRDAVIGMADGLTVPFALAAGLTGAIAESRLIVTAGLAEIAAGSVAMGLGGYLAARSAEEHYASELAREKEEVASVPELEAEEVREIFEKYGLNRDESASLVKSLKQRPRDWVLFMMRFELGLEPVERGRAWKSALTIGGAYVVGGFIPLSAYLFLSDAKSALTISIVVTLIALAIFGGIKAKFTGVPALRGARQTVLVGGLAAAVAFAIARAVS